MLCKRQSICNLFAVAIHVTFESCLNKPNPWPSFKLRCVDIIHHSVEAQNLAMLGRTRAIGVILRMHPLKGVAKIPVSYRLGIRVSMYNCMTIIHDTKGIFVS